MAKAPVAKKDAASDDFDLNDAFSDEMERALADATWVDPPAAAPAPKAAAAKPAVRVETSTYDVENLNVAHSEVQGRLRTFVESFEGLGKSWEGFGDQLSRANGEIERLRGVDRNRSELASRVDDLLQDVTRLEGQISEGKVAADAANERAVKFEDLYEAMKERAVELTTSLQDAEIKIQSVNDELQASRDQLAETGRRLQDETVARTASAEAIRKLEASEVAARDHISKLLDDNKQMAAQVPVLLGDRERLQKQYEASERENTRLNNERQLTGVRVADLEEEIRTLREDLASLSTARAASTLAAAAPVRAAPAARPVVAAAPVVAKEQPAADPLDSLNLDDDFELSLDEAFADMADIPAKGKK